MSAPKLDQTGDKTRVEFNRYARLYELPSYVKEASVEDTFEPADLPVNSYADVRHPPQFPCHTKAATFVSWIYFLEKQAGINHKVVNYIQSRLEKYAAYHGISNAVLELQSKHAGLQRGELGALPDSDFAYVYAAGDSKDRRYPLRNALEVKAAAAWFIGYRDGFPYNDRVCIARKILEKAAQYGADIKEYDDTLEKQAAKGFCHPKQAAALIRGRVLACRMIPELQAQMRKLADSVENTHEMAFTSDQLQKLAETIDTFDRANRVNYTPATPRPEDVLFAVTYSKAANFTESACTLTTGSIYDQKQFAKLSLSDVRDLFGTDIAQDVAGVLNSVDPMKMAEIAGTFPLPDARRLEQLLDEAGLAPIAKQASSLPVGFDFSLLKAAAAN